MRGRDQDEKRWDREPPDHPSCSQNAHDETVLVRCAQTGKKQHVAGGIVAKEYVLAAVEGEKMSVPTAQGTCLAIRLSLWARQIAGGGNPRCQLLSAMENHGSNTTEALSRCTLLQTSGSSKNA